MEAQEYKKLIEALRECASDDPDCIYNCPYYNHDVCADDLKSDAAAAIEALLKENKELIEDHPEMVEADGHWEWIKPNGEVLMPKRGEWIHVQEVDIPGEMHPVAFKCMCSMCRNEYLFPKIPRYCPDCGSMNTAKTEVQDGKN